MAGCLVTGMISLRLAPGGGMALADPVPCAGRMRPGGRRGGGRRGGGSRIPA
jgi:hypothetical protein